MFLNLAFQLYLLQDTPKSVYPRVQNQNFDKAKAKTYACKFHSLQRWLWKTKETNLILLFSHEIMYHRASSLSSIIHILKGVGSFIWRWQGKDIFMTWVGAGGRRNEEVYGEEFDQCIRTQLGLPTLWNWKKTIPPLVGLRMTMIKLLNLVVNDTCDWPITI